MKRIIGPPYIYGWTDGTIEVIRAYPGEWHWYIVINGVTQQCSEVEHGRHFNTRHAAYREAKQYLTKNGTEVR